MIKLHEIRFLASLCLILLCSIKKNRNTALNTITAAAILFVAFGLRHLFLISFTLLINLILLFSRISAFNEYVFIILNMLWLYTYKLFGVWIEPSIGSTFDISGFLMLLIVKMSYLAKELDSKNYNSTADDNKNKRTTVHEALDYILFIPGILSGPTPTFSDFSKRNRNIPCKFPKSSFLKMLLFVAIYAALRMLPCKDLLLSVNSSYLTKLVNLYLFNVAGRMKFHFAWMFAHVCFTLYNFPDFLNIDFEKVELTESIKELSSNWNKFINRWIKEMFFDRIKPRSKTLAVLASYMASACLHGINPCYLLFFLSLGCFGAVVNRANSIIKVKILRQMQMILFVSYFSMAFYVLNLREVFAIWKALYFVGHFYFFGLLVAFWIYDKIKGY